MYDDPKRYDYNELYENEALDSEDEFEADDYDYIEGSGEYVLSPEYDLLPVNANMPADKMIKTLAMSQPVILPSSCFSKDKSKR